MLTQILTHTPRWVFVLLALLVWLGIKQLFAGSVPLWRTALMPVVMTSLSALGIVSAFGMSPTVLAAWAVVAAIACVVVMSRPLPEGTRYDAAARSFMVRGSAVPLLLMMGIFFTKYVVGVMIAMHPELRHAADFSLGIGMAYGAFSGIFLGRAARLLALAVRTDRAGFALSAHANAVTTDAQRV
ncbi:MAG: hypothetical protein KKC79_04330 [Gammaproteobacteria bacterium]|nr:hypothetical protein [Gammaproteobacteria bacterium]MBU1442838.1 hypothetical protein [Gammaproteobacteria bacterium]MBU2407859.1 hypothetical protein [Gammaproteobacteria bacterium]